MDSQTALGMIVARYRQAVEQLDKEYQAKLVETGASICLFGPLFEHEPSAVAAYMEVRAWVAIRREQISHQYASEVQVWFDCFS